MYTKMKLSDQAVGSIMLALQKGIIEQIDITDILKNFEIFQSVDGLVVQNPPEIYFENQEQETPTETTTPTAVKKKTKRKTTTKKKATKKKTTRKKRTTKKVAAKKDSVDA